MRRRKIVYVDVACSAEDCDDVVLGAKSTTELDRCLAQTAACYPKGSSVHPSFVEECLGQPAIAEATKACQPKKPTEVQGFLRGACRDGGDWTKVNE